MNTLSSWIDSDMLAGIVQDLAPVQDLANDFLMLGNPGDSTAGQRVSNRDFRDFRDGSALPPTETKRFRDLLENVKRRASSSGLLREGATDAPANGGSSAPAAPAALVAVPVSQDSVLSKRGLPFFVPPDGPLGTRIRAFTEWLRREVACETLFILDSQGCPVSDHQPSPEVLAAALVLSDAAIRASRHVPSAGDGALHVDLADRKKLCVIHAETTRGHFSLGLVISDVIPTSSADRLRGTLKRCIEAEEGPSSYKGPVRAERW